MALSSSPQIASRFVEASNALTARWARRALTGESTVFSAAGAWPLLAVLATSADGKAREELEAAIGMPGAEGFTGAREALGLMRSSAGVRVALGTWVDSHVPVYPNWKQAIPVGTYGQLLGDGDQRRLDLWASEQTGGLIEQMPLQIDERTLMVLASALMMGMRWRQEFDVVPSLRGEFAGSQGLQISRRNTDLDDLLVADESGVGPLTLVEVRGDHDLSVFLITSNAIAGPGDVVAEAIEFIADPGRCRRGSAFELGDSAPGVRVRKVPDSRQPKTLRLTTVPFDVKASHDLLGDADLFGLVTASDARRGHFGRISEMPLAVSHAKQVTKAAFSTTGFVAAAVTAVDVMIGFAGPSGVHVEVSAEFECPFGFAAVHRPSGLVLVAGWVTEPQLPSQLSEEATPRPLS